MRLACSHPRIPSAAAMALVIAGALLGGCQSPGVIFPPVEPAIQWPPAPQEARIRYVGQLATSADLKPGRTFFEGLGQALFGKKDLNVMAGPTGVCTDGADRVFVADPGGQMVHVFNLNTRKYAQWKPAEPDRFTQPVALTWDSLNQRLLVSDSIGETIFVFDTAGKTVGQIGRKLVRRPAGLAVDPKTGRVFVTDVTGHQVVVLSPQGELVQRLGQRGTLLGEFNYPTHVTLDSQGRLYVADSMNFRVQQFSPDLKPIRQIGKQGDMPGYFAQPKGVAVDRDDHLFVVDARFESVQIFDDQGQLLLYFGEEGTKPGEFFLPSGMFIDANNRIWVADTYNKRIQVFDYVPQTKMEAKP